MNADRLKKYKTQLRTLEQRLDGEIKGLVSEIDSNLLALHEHEADTSEVINADISMSENEAAELVQVRTALSRIEAGTFGVCEGCHKSIPAPRLNAIPYTPFCIACELKHEQQ